MQLDGKEWTIVGMVAGWLVTVYGIGRAFGGLVIRVEALEKKSTIEVVTEKRCDERHTSCEKGNNIKFTHGEKQFDEIKKLIADNHREFMSYIREN